MPRERDDEEIQDVIDDAFSFDGTGPPFLSRQDVVVGFLYFSDVSRKTISYLLSLSLTDVKASIRRVAHHHISLHPGDDFNSDFKGSLLDYLAHTPPT